MQLLDQPPSLQRFNTNDSARFGPSRSAQAPCAASVCAPPRLLVAEQNCLMRACRTQAVMRKEPLWGAASRPQTDAARACGDGDVFPTCGARTASDGPMRPCGRRRTVGSRMRSEEQPRNSPALLLKEALQTSPPAPGNGTSNSWRRQSVAAASRLPGKERELAKRRGKTRLRSCRLVAGQ